MDSGPDVPEDEDSRRICRERKVLIMERVQHVQPDQRIAVLSRRVRVASRCVAIDGRGWMRFELAIAIRN